ncbi:hypothetical protein L204_100869 [Cryptococcus depauperatus]|nr:rossman fold oxidoreductase [Cryptococcus depauperatus CBS 7855]
MSVAIIQGASGGLGVALTRHFLQHTNLKIYALTHQAASSQLVDVASPGTRPGRSINDRLTVVEKVDVREESGLERAAEMVKSREGNGVVRAIVCLAGVLHPEKSLSAINPKEALTSFQINALGQLLTYKHFVPLIPSKREFQKLKEWHEDPARGLIGVNNSICCSLSARVGSIGDNKNGGWYSYRASKAAVNQIIRTLDYELINKQSSAIAYAYHPGTILTSFTYPIIGDLPPDISKGRFTVDQAVRNMGVIMGKVKRGANDGGMGGKCWDWKGERIEW